MACTNTTFVTKSYSIVPYQFFFYVCPLVIIREPCSTLGSHSVADEDDTTDWYIDTNVSVQLAVSILRVAQE